MQVVACEGEPLVHATLGGYNVHCSEHADFSEFVTYASDAARVHEKHRHPASVSNPYNPNLVEALAEMEWSSL